MMDYEKIDYGQVLTECAPEAANSKSLEHERNSNS